MIPFGTSPSVIQRECPLTLKINVSAIEKYNGNVRLNPRFKIRFVLTLLGTAVLNLIHAVYSIYMDIHLLQTMCCECFER